jgi:hypothetical protein
MYEVLRRQDIRRMRDYTECEDASNDHTPRFS